MRGISNHFNRGQVDDEALARDDLKRVNSSAELMTNFIPMRLGPMTYRPGFKYISNLVFGFIPHYVIPFMSSRENNAIIDFSSAGTIGFLVDGLPIASTSVTTTFTNGAFTSNTTGWTDGSSGSASVDWATGGYMSLTGDGDNSAIAHQSLSTDTGSQHFLQLTTKEAPLTVKIGTSGAGSTELYEGELRPGEHVLAFTPTANITVTLENNNKYRTLVDFIRFGGNSNITFNSDISNLEAIRYKQSIDVIYVAHEDGPPLQIERRGEKSWSLVEYQANDGPYGFINNSNIKLTPSALDGDTTVVASESFFKASDVGRILKIASQGLQVEATTTSNTGAGTESIKVTGVGYARQFNINITMSAGYTNLQQSVDNITWANIDFWTADANTTFRDDLDNSIMYYRLYVASGSNPTNVSIDMALTYAGGTADGTARITGFTSGTTVAVKVYNAFGKLEPSGDFYMGEWRVGNYPTAVDIFEGRLWWAGQDKLWGSVSDLYYSFDSSIEGNSQAIQKTIGFGSLDPIRWIKSATRLVLGTDLDEMSIRSSNYGDVLTQSTTSIKSGSNQGSSFVDPIIIDDSIYFVQFSGQVLYSISAFIDSDKLSPVDLNVLNRDITRPGIKRLAFTRQPETRIYCVLNDGNVAVYTLDLAEDVSAWSLIELDGNVIDVVVFPEAKEDRVYFILEIGGGTSTVLVKMDFFHDTTQSALDYYKDYKSPGTTITGLAHLETEQVYVNGDGVLRGPYGVVSGQITVPAAYTDAYVGMRYEAEYISSKLGGYSQETVLTERKRVIDTGLCLKNYYQDSIKIGPTGVDGDDLLKALPSIEKGVATTDDTLIAKYTELPFSYDGRTEPDPRIRIKATGPCTILALTYGIEDADNPHGNKG